MQGHWAVSFIEESDAETEVTKKEYTKLPFVVDPSVIFGMTTGFSEPSSFFDGDKGAKEIAMGPQVET